MAAPPLLLLLPLFLIPASAFKPISPSSLVLSACAHARYPSLCVRTLTPSAALTPDALTVDATSAAASSAQNASAYLRSLPSPPPPAVGDCAELISDSSYQLSRAAAELRRLLPENSRWQLNNALTWASAALTDDDTCLDAVRRLSYPMGSPVSARVMEARRFACNALYLVSRLAGNAL